MGNNATTPETEQERAWGDLYDQIVAVMARFGKADYCGQADYLIVDDNYGWLRHKIEVQNLAMLQPEAVAALRNLLTKFPNWEIVLAVDVPGREGQWPSMGLTIRHHEVIDGLRREFLPSSFQNIRYDGARAGTGYD
jgi:hypothetical protein